MVSIGLCRRRRVVSSLRRKDGVLRALCGGRDVSIFGSVKRLKFRTRQSSQGLRPGLLRQLLGVVRQACSVGGVCGGSRFFCTKSSTRLRAFTLSRSLTPVSNARRICVVDGLGALPQTR